MARFPLLVFKRILAVLGPNFFISISGSSSQVLCSVIYWNHITF